MALAEIAEHFVLPGSNAEDIKEVKDKDTAGKDRNRLVVLDYGGGMNLTDMKEAVDVFYQGQTE